MKIPKKFYYTQDKSYPVIVKTVGELKKVIDELPDDLKIEQGFESGVSLIVCNYKNDISETILIFEEVED